MVDAIREPRPWILFAVAALVLVVPATGEWTQWRQDATHAGEAEPAVPIHEPGVAWQHVADQHPIAAPVVGQIDGETRTVIATYPDDEGEAGSVFAFDEDGDELWEQTPSPLTTGGFVASPAIVEDADGAAVIAAKAEDSTVYRLDAGTGEIEASWQMGSSNKDVIVSPPTVADVTGDGEPEIVVGGSGSDDEGAVFVLDTSLDTVIDEKELNAPVWSSPLVRDLDGDGSVEIAVSTGVPDAGCIVFGTLHTTNDPKTGDDEGRLYVFEHRAGGLADVWDAPLEGPTMSSPASGDLTGDGSSEIVVGSQAPRGSCSDVTNVQTDGHLEVFASDATRIDVIDGSLVLSVTTPLVTDLDGEGTPEVVHGAWNGIRAQNVDATGFQPAGSFEIVADDRHDQDHWVLAAPTAVDLDDDGGRDIVGLSIPVDINEQSPLESEVKPGAVFVLTPDAARSDTGLVVGPLTVDTDGFEPRWVYPTPEDGGLAGPVAADANGDGLGEILVGTGFPVIGQSTTTRVLAPNNPVVQGFDTDPVDVRTVDDVTFEANVADNDHSAGELSYAWDLGDGATTTAASPTHTYDDDGTYTITLDVSDPDGHAWQDERTLTVANVAPDVTADLDTTPGSLEVTFEATAEDPDGTVETLAWELDDGTRVEEATFTHTYDTSGTYQATFEAVDDDGDTSTRDVTVDVNRFPSLTGPSQADAVEDETVVVQLPYDDPDGDPVRLLQLDAPDDVFATVVDDHVRIAWTPPFDTTTRAEAPAEVPIAATIEDGGSPSGTDTHTFTFHVEDTNRPPTIGGADEVKASSGETGSASGTVDDPDGDLVTVVSGEVPSYASIDDEEGAWTITLSPPPNADRTTHHVTLEADDGLTNATHDVALEVFPNLPPEPAIDGPALVDAHTVQDPSWATFEGTADDPDGDAVTRWLWTVGDLTRHGTAFSYPFLDHGTYTLELEAWDENRASGTTTHTLAVDDALTGGLVAKPVEAGPNANRTVSVYVNYEDGTRLPGASVDLTVHHESFEEPTHEQTVATGPDGQVHVRLTGEMGLGFFLPGEHTVEIETKGPSLPSAPVDDTEHVTMTDSFTVTPT